MGMMSTIGIGPTKGMGSNMSMGSTMGMGSIMAKKCNMRVRGVQVPREYRQKSVSGNNEGGEKVNCRPVSSTRVKSLDSLQT